MIYAFIYGVVLAFGLIIPLGVQNVFVFNQGANQRHFLKAMPSVLTASLCDTILIICAVLGVSVAGHFLHKLDKKGLWLQMVNKLSALIIWAVAGFIGWQVIKLIY